MVFGDAKSGVAVGAPAPCTVTSSSGTAIKLQIPQLGTFVIPKGNTEKTVSHVYDS